MANILCCFFYNLVLFLAIEAFERKLEYKPNPGCDIPECKPPNNTLNLIHVKAIGSNDTLHYIWSTVNLPSVLITQTSNDAALEINWKGVLKLEDGAIWFTENPKQSIGLILTNIFEYIDEDDKVLIPNSNTTVALNLTDVNWSPAFKEPNSPSSILQFSSFASNSDAVFSDKGQIKVQFSAASTHEPDVALPHLLFNGNSTQLNVVLDNLVTSDKSRFAIEFTAIASYPNVKKSWFHEINTTSNDEYSPGTFKIHSLFPPCESESNSKFCAEPKFLMWKPVAYIGVKPSVANSSDATLVDLSLPGSIPASAVSMFYNNTNVTISSWNMTVGMSGDGFYTNTKYMSWSAMLGVGIPSSEELSVLAKIIIGVGLGAPLFIMFAGGLYLIYKKCHKEDEDELLLDG